MMKRVYLIGYMGSGKTTLGKAFAQAAHLQFIDLDWYIEERMHKAIKDLFAERGEEGFRQVERNMLHEAGEFENVVIAAGTGWQNAWRFMGKPNIGSRPIIWRAVNR